MNIGIVILVHSALLHPIELRKRMVKFSQVQKYQSSLERRYFIDAHPFCGATHKAHLPRYEHLVSLG